VPESINDRSIAMELLRIRKRNNMNADIRILQS